MVGGPGELLSNWFILNHWNNSIKDSLNNEYILASILAHQADMGSL